MLLSEERKPAGKSKKQSKTQRCEGENKPRCHFDPFSLPDDNHRSEDLSVVNMDQ